ncbi:MAG: HAD family phosphatase [Alphaproteobacteria bacterium]|nr:HAD family phosphatase [Alphaproteobacteria bacterium]
MFKSVIFDFDGVIADTMHDNFLAWEKTFLHYGVQINQLDYFLLEGAGRNEVGKYFIQKYKLKQHDLLEIVKLKETNYLLNNHFKIYSYVLDILEFLTSKNVALGLVTGASKDRIFNSLNNKLLSYFKTIITSDEVEFGKPNPEPYLKAIQNIQLLPENCLIIENAQLGIQSAKSAGCKCWAITTTLPKQHLTLADLILNNHQDVFTNIKKIYEN